MSRYVYLLYFINTHSTHFKVILVQVNPGEAFTIRREDGQFQCITGKNGHLLSLEVRQKFIIEIIYGFVSDYQHSRHKLGIPF